MSKIVLQPAGNKDGNVNYVDSMANPVSIDRIVPFVDEKTIHRLRELYREGVVPTWGVRAGKKDVNRKKWERVEPGDIVLFSREKMIFASASVSFKIHNKKLALELWKTNKEGETWEYMYFVDEVEKQNIKCEDFNLVAKYKLNNPIRNFNVLSEEKSQRIIAYFELRSETYFPPISTQEYFDALLFDPSKALDKKSVAKARTEQSFLRNVLFQGKKYADCGICGAQFPISFLVAAHIKKRADCTDEEKRDFKNIVIPMCKFGCDELYERGYIAVADNAAIISLKSSSGTEAVRTYIKQLDGQKCGYWTTENSKYFQWHLEKFK